MSVATGQRILVLLAMCWVTGPAYSECEPPYSGTAFLHPDILIPSDSSLTQSLTYTGRGFRTMYDRRVGDFVEYNAYLFDLQFSDGLSAEVQVNPEFGDVVSAEAVASEMSHPIGQLPNVLREDVETVWIHQGDEAFGGGNNNLLIHTARADTYAADGVIEEIFLHEATHTSLDAEHAESTGWQEAQQADDCFISTYGEKFPVREDLAESLVPFIAVTLRGDRIGSASVDTIETSIPARLDYLDSQGFNLDPMVDTATVFEDNFELE